MSFRGKFYFYVDETGQHTQGRMFVVAVACLDAQEQDELAAALVAIEHRTKKGQRKWVRTPAVVRQSYLGELSALCKRHPGLRVYYRVYGDGTDYLNRTSETLADVICAYQPQANANLVIVVDGLNPEERQQIGRHLRRWTLPYSRTVRGGRDEATPFIRLVDAVAGFVRHARCDEPYAKPLWEQLKPHLHEVQAD